MRLRIDFNNSQELKEQLQDLLQSLQYGEKLNPSPSVQTRTEGESGAGQQIATVAKDRIFEVVLSPHYDVGPGWRGILRGDDGDGGLYLEFTGLFTKANSAERNQETRTVWFEEKNVKEIYP